MIKVNNKYTTAVEFFENYAGRTETVQLRGIDKKIVYRSARFEVKLHGKKMCIIALKYEDEAEYQYLIANDMAWRDVDVIKSYSYRWLVEVFFSRLEIV